MEEKQGKDYIKFGDTREMELTYGKVEFTKKWFSKIWPWSRIKYAGKFKFGYNQTEDMFFIQITHKMSQESMRIYLTANQLVDKIHELQKTYDITRADLGNVADD
jgi:hypothetical protein